MENGNYVNVKGINVDIEKAERLKYKLIALENSNIKTKDYNEGKMLEIIKKMIEEEVECY